MGIHEKTEHTIPDTSNIPEFFISEIFTEIDGPNIRIVCGVKRGGIVHWLYSCVMRADLAIANNLLVGSAAVESVTINRRLKGH